MKQFHELNESELEELRKTQRERATAEGRDLLQDVVCAIRPNQNKCQCSDELKERMAAGETYEEIMKDVSDALMEFEYPNKAEL